MTKSLILAILLVAGLSSGSFAANETPNEVVESAVALFAAGLDGRRDELAADRAALYELIDEILLPRFDRKYAAQVVLARHWRDASESQRERFIEAFYQALLRRYADGLLQFESDKVKVLPYRGDASKSRTRVRSTVQLENGSKVAVDYDLVKRESGWLLFNVSIEGVSYVRNFRAEIDSEIRSSSLDAAIRRLEREAGISSDE
ncbi:MAG: ABC transporter substrate-binding protein [Proteobacteria bacterium]|nr:ABC transporter substrate-binding protein [Pseudomonadota bacterium]